MVRIYLKIIETDDRKSLKEIQQVYQNWMNLVAMTKEIL